MSKMIAYCGLDCNQCNAYKATIVNDDSLREQTAAEWSKMFGVEIKADDINCLGCKSALRIGNCNVCGIRTCGVSKSVENCAECSDFGCKQIVDFLSMAPEAKANLESLRAK